MCQEYLGIHNDGHVRIPGRLGQRSLHKSCRKGQYYDSRTRCSRVDAGRSISCLWVHLHFTTSFYSFWAFGIRCLKWGISRSGYPERGLNDMLWRQEISLMIWSTCHSNLSSATGYAFIFHRSISIVTHDKVRLMQLSGTALPSFVSSLLDEQKPGTLDAEVEEDMKAVSGNIYSAGVETVRALLGGEQHSHWYNTQTNSIKLAFVLAMVRNPQLAKKAQEEIDRVVGTDRMPTLDDRERLPYLDCIFKETLRYDLRPLLIQRCTYYGNICSWSPPVPLSTSTKIIWQAFVNDRLRQVYHIVSRKKTATMACEFHWELPSCPIFGTCCMFVRDFAWGKYFFKANHAGRTLLSWTRGVQTRTLCGKAGERSQRRNIQSFQFCLWIWAAVRFYSASISSFFKPCSELIEFVPVDFLLIQRSGSW